MINHVNLINRVMWRRVQEREILDWEDEGILLRREYFSWNVNDEKESTTFKGLLCKYKQMIVTEPIFLPTRLQK